MSQTELMQSLSEQHRKHLDPSSPAPMRMMASKGMAPLPPRETVIVLVGLTMDADAALADSARQSLQKLPDKIASAALDSGLPALAIAAFAPLLLGRDDLVERVLLDRNTPDEAVAALAHQVSERLSEIILSNQERCMRSVAIVRAVRENPNALRSSLDRLFDFLVRAGVIYDDIPEFGEAMARLSPAEIAEAAEKIELPPEVASLFSETPEDEERANVAAEALEEGHQTPERVPTLKLISTLTASQKVALAIKGNREARTILVRDSNRVVASSAIRNPRITEQEVIAAAQSRSVSDEVIRIISTSKELMRAYSVKLALVANPKTPLPTAMRFLTLLRENDVKNISKSKNVSSAISTQAQRLLKAKKT